MERRKKRSQNARLVLMGAASAVMVSGCDVDQQHQRPQFDLPQPKGAPVFTTLEQCVDEGSFTAEECSEGMEFALKQQAAQGQRTYRSERHCELASSDEECHEVQTKDGGSIWMPLIGGYLIGSALSDRGDRNYYGYYPYGSGWSYRTHTGGIGRSTTPPSDIPRPKNAVSPPKPKPRAAHRTSVSRGGFGSGARSSGWGG